MLKTLFCNLCEGKAYNLIHTEVIILKQYTVKYKRYFYGVSKRFLSFD